MLAVKSKPVAENVMTPNPICVVPSTTLRQLARIFNEYEISGVPVQDAQGRVIGMVSKTDLIRRCLDGFDEVPPGYLFEMLSETGVEDSVEMSAEQSVFVQDFMTEDPLTVTRETPVREIARQMCERRIHRVVVTDGDGCPVGIITSLDLMDALSR